ncbi:TetR/AcrR family transcriptional regulator [Pannonibacter phragmitetus]|uniref:TetR/AcrR family transcriptional regulator n=1 Tax=Pannonibacter phragmitetus TaxID=121719 RepID=UPI003D2EF846
MTAMGKRSRILSATAELLMEQGLLAVQTRMVTERAGVGTGLLNHYFRWPDLRAQAWAAIFDAVAADLHREGESAAEALERFMSESFCRKPGPFGACGSRQSLLQ